METEQLGRPDFDLLHEKAPIIAGVRPHRDGGARLEVSRPVDTPMGHKIVIHNYGHGGAGMTLSFGSAAGVCDRLAKIEDSSFVDDEMPAIAILGTGIIGMTTAQAIRERWPAVPVTVYARQLDVTRTTSFAAGGQFVPASTLGEYGTASQQALLDQLLSRSRARLERFVEDDDAERYGIARMQSYSLDTGSGANVRLDFGETKLMARRYGSWLLDPTRLLPALRTELSGNRVAFVERHFQSLPDVYALPERIIINCTGYGARALFGDGALEARRGLLVVLRNPDNLRYFLNSWCGEASTRYLFARFDDIVIGGTIQRGSEAEAYDPADPEDVSAGERILRRARALFEKTGNKCA
jgi:D-amino-acid oxidase